MACSLPHNVVEIKAMVQKQIEEDKVHQLAIMNLAVEYDNACTTKDELRNVYEKCIDIPLDTILELDGCYGIKRFLELRVSIRTSLGLLLV
ncbi:hypothetical protein Tco_1194450 [Tanacetum coccineum]